MASLSPAPFGTYALTVLGYIGIFLLLPPINDYLGRVFPFYEHSVQSLQRLYVANDVVGTLLRSSLVTPVLEETLFRGIVFAGLARRYRLSTALVVSSLIFALYHHNVAQVLGPLLSGLLFAAAYQRFASLLPCFLGHALTNFVWFISSFYHSLSNPERRLFNLDPSLDVPRIIVGGIVLSLSVALLLCSTRKKESGSSDTNRMALGSSAI
jgi:membrane protease YdiL (CAAX protease family)